MKIGIITIQKCNNFGADLQAFALQRKLQLMGYDAENIDYLYYKHPDFVRTRRSRPIFRLSLVNRIKEWLLPKVVKVKGWKQGARIKARDKAFAEFFTNNVRSSKGYKSIGQLYATPPKYDVYITGSDQVWNPRTATNLEPYFLTFAPSGARSISYASSIGPSEISAGAFYKFKNYLKKYSAIGVREKSAAEIVGAMGLTAEVKHVLDPTLLLDAETWNKVALKTLALNDIPDKYLLVYDLLVSPETMELARRVAKSKGLPIIKVSDGAYGPGEFIWLFAHADFVITNSFHGTAFSLIYKKDFYSVIPRGMGNAGRIKSLLHLVGVDNRLIRAEDVDNFSGIQDVDWESVIARLDAARGDSVDFLRRAVDGKSVVKSPTLPLGCYAAWNTDDKIRASSTSGGIFRVIAEEIIVKGGVVFGAAFTSDFHRVEHVVAESVQALDPLMKSKYVWSDSKRAYAEALDYLKKGRSVLFAGTPCQIAAIRTMASGNEEKLVTVDIVCHGTPRPEIFESYISELEDRFAGKVKSYEFRNKDAGWNFPRVKCEFDSGRGYNAILRNDPYYLAFGLNLSLKSSCFSCPYVGLERVSDITIADCWRVASSHPECDDNRGTSLVLVNSKKGCDLWRGIVDSGKVYAKEYDIDLAQMRNMPLQQKARKPFLYERFNKVFEETKSFSEASKCFMNSKLVFRATLIYWIKKIGWFYFRRHQ